jgi:hypothetical protein
LRVPPRVQQIKSRRPSVPMRPLTQGYEHIPYLSGLKSKNEKYDKDSKLAKAYEVALDTRKFEIELYWKRATYFWAIAAVVLGAIGLVIANSIKDDRFNSFPTLLMIETLSCVGFIVTKAWQYVNLGGKFWQHNWELHVDVLEQEVLIPLFQTVLAECQKSGMREENTASQPGDPKDDLMVVFSPSKVNDFLGRFLNMIFIVIGCSAFFLILLKIGFIEILAARLGIADIEKFLVDSSIWLVPFIAIMPIFYTLHFWIRMAGNARTTTLMQHPINVTQRTLAVKEKINLPESKEKRGFRKGVIRVAAELKLVSESPDSWLSKLLLPREDRSATQDVR